jgi:hypothetical protein
MEPLVKILTERLVEKGMEVTSIPAFIRNIANIMVTHPSASVDELNNRLQFVGWGDFKLDDYILQLIIAAFESGISFRPKPGLDLTSKLTNSVQLGSEHEHLLPVRDDHKCIQE